MPLLAEIIEAVQEKEGIIQATPQLNDMAAGLFNFSYAVGCIIAPILGGYLNEIFKFRQTCDIMAMASLAYGVFYFFVRILGDKFFIPKHKP